MIKKYVIVEKSDIETLNSREEVDICISMLKQNNPKKDYEVKEIDVSAVKRGFGRDPDLH
jgi:hypothetical protein